MKTVNPFLDFYALVEEIRTQLLPCSNIVNSYVSFAEIVVCYY